MQSAPMMPGQKRKLGAITRVAIWIGGAIAVILLMIVVRAVYQFHHNDVGPPPIPPTKVISLLNNCYFFTHIGPDMREATSVTRVTKLPKSESHSNIVEFKWRWISGPQARNASETSERIMVSWNWSGDRRKDWDWSEDQWDLGLVDRPDGQASPGCEHLR